MMRKIVLFLFAAGALTFFLSPRVFARNPFVPLEPSLKASRAALPSGAVAGIKKIRAELEAKVAAKLAQLEQKPQKRGWVGLVKKRDQSSLMLICRHNKEREVLLDAEATVLDQKRHRRQISDLKVGQRLLVMGYLKSENTLLARRVIILPLRVTKVKIMPIFGVIADRSRAAKVFSLLPVNNKEAVFEFLVTRKTKIWLRKKDIEPAAYQDLTPKSRAVVIYRLNGDGDRQALKILVMSKNEG